MTTRLRTLLACVATAAVVYSAALAAAKEAPPKPGKMKKLSFPAFKEFKSKNGIEVLVVEHHEQPVVSILAIVKTGSAFDPDGKESLAGFTVDLLNKGTKTRSALELAEWIESVGGTVSSSAQEDWSQVTVTVLSEYLDVAYAYLRDVFLNATFPEDELELAKKQAKTGLELELSNPGAMAGRHIRELVYGDHPYAKQATVGSVEAITREDVVSFYKRNFVANNVMLSVVGDVKWKDVKKAVKKHFGNWPTGTPDRVEYAGAHEAGASKIYLYHKPGAVQTEIRVGHLGPKATNADWPAIVVANRILGGGADARLFMDLREDKGWTYGAYSSFTREKDLAMFTARTAVRTEVTDSALVELLGELKRIREEPVSEDDLKNAKDYLIGNFPIAIETPGQIAAQIARYKLRGLSVKQLESYRDRLAAVTVDDVARVAKTYIHPENAYVVLVGDAGSIQEKVAAVADVELFDIAGEPLSLSSIAVEPVDYDYDTSMLKNIKATYALSVQEMALGDMNVELQKTMRDGEEIIAVSSSLAGMISLNQSMEFRAKDLSPITYKSSMQMGPRTMGAEFAFTEGAGSGTVRGGDSDEPREIKFDMVDGTIMDGALEYAIGCLPLEVDKSFRFPVIDGQTGSLQTINVKILGTVDVETAAGNFKTFRIEVKRPEGNAFMYLGVERPHILVKQEVPSQAMSMLLKSIAN